MKIIFILLCIIGLFFIFRTEESFTDLDKTFIDKYNTFMTFYNQFLVNYTKAVTTSWGLAQPPPKEGTKASTPSNDQLNSYIVKLSQKEGPLPSITDPLPSIQTTDDLVKIQSIIPQDPAPYKHALEWMNTNLEKAQGGLGNALSAVQGFTDLQGFTDIATVRGYATKDYNTMEFFDVCQQIQTCQQQQQQSLQTELEPVFVSFTSLQPLLDKNNELLATSQHIQDQAQNGTLLPKPAPRVSPYTVPKGSNKLVKMQQENPDQYHQYQQNYGQFFALKQYSDQINANLR